MNGLPFSQACENNKQPIIDVIAPIFGTSRCVLEIGSGTGQHSVYFAKELPHLNWMTSDQDDYHDGISAWIEAYPSKNLHHPLSLTFPHNEWPSNEIDGVFTANTAHIMQVDEVKSMMGLINDNLPVNGHFCQYGPFRQNDKFSSQSNADFHESLIAGGYGGYRDIDELVAWAPSLNLVNIYEMPANNLLLHWQKD